MEKEIVSNGCVDQRRESDYNRQDLTVAPTHLPPLSPLNSSNDLGNLIFGIDVAEIINSGLQVIVENGGVMVER